MLNPKHNLIVNFESNDERKTILRLSQFKLELDS